MIMVTKYLVHLYITLVFIVGTGTGTGGSTSNGYDYPGENHAPYN
jgi:hypothetical protein